MERKTFVSATSVCKHAYYSHRKHTLSIPFLWKHDSWITYICMTRSIFMSHSQIQIDLSFTMYVQSFRHVKSKSSWADCICSIYMLVSIYHWKRNRGKKCTNSTKHENLKSCKCVRPFPPSLVINKSIRRTPTYPRVQIR